MYLLSPHTDKKLTVDIGTNEFIGELKVGDKVYNVYLENMEVVPLIGKSYRDANGCLHREKAMLKHKFQLIEV